jgi:hypothetical protein
MYFSSVKTVYPKAGTAGDSSRASLARAVIIPHPSWRRISSGDGGGIGSRDRRARYSRTRCFGGFLVVAVMRPPLPDLNLVPILEATG